MKKNIFTFLVLITFTNFSHSQNKKEVSDIPEYTEKIDFHKYNDIQFSFYSKVINEKNDKKEYKFTVMWYNTTDKDIYYMSNKNFGSSTMIKFSSYFFDFFGEETDLSLNGKNIYIIKAGKKYKHHYFEKWIKNNQDAFGPGVNIKMNDVVFASSIDELKEKIKN